MNIMSLINLSITDISDYGRDFWLTRLIPAMFIFGIVWIVIAYLKDYEISLWERVIEGKKERYEQADKAARELLDKADNFDVCRRLTVFNCFSHDTIFIVTGYMSVDEGGGVLRIYVKNDNTYQKYMVKLSDNITYTLENLTNPSGVINQIEYNPNIWLGTDNTN